MNRALPPAPPDYQQNWAQRLVEDIENNLIRLNQPAKVGYLMTNVTATRSLNADSTTLAEVADVLGTLIDDLKATGRLG